MAQNPAAKILIISYGQELADKIAYEIRSILQCDWFRRLFKTRLGKSKLNDLSDDRRRRRALGFARRQRTGFGADLIIVDDAVQIKDCDNDRQLQRVNALFDGEIRTRLNNQKKGAIVIVAHHKAENDLPGHVLAEGGWKLARSFA